MTQCAGCLCLFVWNDQVQGHSPTITWPRGLLPVADPGFVCETLRCLELVGCHIFALVNPVQVKFPKTAQSINSVEHW